MFDERKKYIKKSRWIVLFRNLVKVGAEIVGKLAQRQWGMEPKLKQNNGEWRQSKGRSSENKGRS